MRDKSSDAAAWGVLLFLVVAVLLMQWREPLPIAPAGLLNLGVASIALGGTAFFYSRFRPEPRFVTMCIGLMQVLLFSTLAALLSYLLAREGGALWDETFAAWDRAIGFDWYAYVRLVDRSAFVTALFHLAYISLVPQVVMLVLALGFTGRRRHLRVVMLAAMLSGTVTVILSTFFPAVSNFVALGLSPQDFTHVDPHAGFIHLADFEALRAGTMTELRLETMQGIITFPSYHAGLAAVTLWGFWRCGIRWLQLAGVTLAFLTIVATPVDGGHYLVDVIAGLVIGAASIAAAGRLVAWVPAGGLRPSPFRRSHAVSAP